MPLLLLTGEGSYTSNYSSAVFEPLTNQVFAHKHKMGQIKDTSFGILTNGDVLSYQDGNWINSSSSELIDDRVDALIQDGTNISWTYNDSSGTLTPAVSASGSTKQIQFNNSGSLGGATGFEYQSGASPNVLITAQDAAHVPLKVQGAASQTANIFEIRNSADTLITSAKSWGGLDVTLSTSTDSQHGLVFGVTSTNTSGIGTLYGVTGQLSYAGSGGVSNAYGGFFRVLTTGSSPTTANASSLMTQATSNRTTSSLTCYGIVAWGNAGTGTLTNAWAFRVPSPINAQSGSGGVLTSAYGLDISDITVATNNYAIRTNAGLVVINEGGNANSDLRVEGDTDANLFFTDASADRVGIGTNAPNEKLEVVGTVRADGLRLDVTPTAETPTATHTVTINLNGTDYKLLCLAA